MNHTKFFGRTAAKLDQVYPIWNGYALIGKMLDCRLSSRDRANVACARPSVRPRAAACSPAPGFCTKSDPAPGVWPPLRVSPETTPQLRAPMAILLNRLPLRLHPPSRLEPLSLRVRIQDFNLTKLTLSNQIRSVPLFALRLTSKLEFNLA